MTCTINVRVYRVTWLPFYVMAQSFVKFLVERATLEKLRGIFVANDFDAELLNATGKTAVDWKDQWLADLRR